MSAMILISYTLLIEKIFEMEDYWLLLPILMVLIRAFIEPYIVSIEHNIFLVTFILLFKEKQECIKKLE